MDEHGYGVRAGSRGEPKIPDLIEVWAVAKGGWWHLGAEDEVAEGMAISVGTSPVDGGDTSRGDDRCAPPGFPPGDVGDVHLDHGQFDSLEGVKDRVRVMGDTPRG